MVMRMESISFQCHPNDEQNMINLMQQFCWNLLSTQEIKTVDSHLERRGDSIYSVTNAEHYVKLAFHRDLDTPNLKEIKVIEDQYFAIKPPKSPEFFPLWTLLTFLLCCSGFLIWPIYYFVSYQPNAKAYKQLVNQQEAQKRELLSRLQQYR